ncbi:MAG TPA: hypothetical protein VEZ24_12805 [Microvirga sp.]|nr:hypothetical protein [Microvirga sp.]
MPQGGCWAIGRAEAGGEGRQARGGHDFRKGMGIEVILGFVQKEDTVDVNADRELPKDELEENVYGVVREFHVQNDAGRIAERSADIGSPRIGQRMPLEEELCGRRDDLVHVAVELIVDVRPDDVDVSQAEVGDDILDVAGKDFLESIHIKTRVGRFCRLGRISASHFDLVRM